MNKKKKKKVNEHLSRTSNEKLNYASWKLNRNSMWRERKNFKQEWFYIFFKVEIQVNILPVSYLAV